MNKIIISDTSCLIALTNINKLNILKDLFNEVIITSAVSEEFGELLPDWILVAEVKDRQKQSELEKKLDTGEASSLALAIEINNSLLIIDEVKGRKIAQSLGIDIIGTIGVLILAHKNGLVEDVIGTLLTLVNKGFRLSDELIGKIIEKYSK